MLWNWLIPCTSPHLLPATSPREGMLWGSGALPASGTRAFEEEEVAREGWLAQSSGSLRVTPRSHPRDAVLGRGDVLSNTTPLCTATGAQHQACTAPLATPKLPEELFDFHHSSSHTGQTRRAQSPLFTHQESLLPGQHWDGAGRPQPWHRCALQGHRKIRLWDLTASSCLANTSATH